MAIERFHIQVAEEALNDLRERLDHIRWPDQMADSSWEQGTERGYFAVARSLLAGPFRLAHTGDRTEPICSVLCRGRRVQYSLHPSTRSRTEPAADHSYSRMA